MRKLFEKDLSVLYLSQVLGYYYLIYNWGVQKKNFKKFTKNNLRQMKLFLNFLILFSYIWLLNSTLVSNCLDLQNMSSTGTYTISQTIDCKGIAFIPISTFYGTLLGNNNTIQNVVPISYSKGGGLGIFQLLDGAIIQDLILLNFTLNCTGCEWTGSLSGKAQNTTIKNVHLAALASSPNIICGRSCTGGPSIFSFYLRQLKFKKKKPKRSFG